MAAIVNIYVGMGGGEGLMLALAENIRVEIFANPDDDDSLLELVVVAAKTALRIGNMKKAILRLRSFWKMK
jgi:hypothetical protein